MFSFSREEIKSTNFYRKLQRINKSDAEAVARSRILAFAENTWKRHASSIRSLIQFCKNRQYKLFKCKPEHICIFLLDELKKEKTVSTISATLDAYTFVVNFFDMRDCSKHKSVKDVMKFVEKAGVKNSNKKNAFGEAEVYLTYVKLVKKFGEIECWDKLLLRTFMLAVFQHKTFCRFSDAQKIRLKDVTYDIDHFKMLIVSSKTDQCGKGEFVYLPKVGYEIPDMHMLMCKYIQIMDLDNTGIGNVYLFPLLTPKLAIVEGKALSYNVALKNFKIMLQHAHLDPKLYGLHSPRIGAATDAFFKNIPYHVIDQQGRWKSSNTKFNYLRLNENHLLHHITK
jgi:hypothetical protein